MHLSGCMWYNLEDRIRMKQVKIQDIPKDRLKDISDTPDELGLTYSEMIMLRDYPPELHDDIRQTPIKEIVELDKDFSQLKM